MKNTRLVAKTIITNDVGKVLVLRRSRAAYHDGAGAWDLPGGILEANEDPVQGAVREAREETGLSVENLMPVHIHSEDRKDIFVITFVFLAKLPNMKLVLSFEHDEYRWVDNREFKLLTIPDKYKEAVVRYSARG